MSKANEYIPERFDEKYVKVLVETTPCAECKRPTLRVPRERDTFPAWFEANLEAQMKRAGILAVGMFIDDGRLCVECVKSGVATCTCALCGEKKRSDEIEESFGYPADRLCKACYQTVPAAKWDAMKKKLEEEHRYDEC